jgi:hypothetical protein
MNAIGDRLVDANRAVFGSGALEILPADERHRSTKRGGLAVAGPSTSRVDDGLDVAREAVGRTSTVSAAASPSPRSSGADAARAAPRPSTAGTTRGPRTNAAARANAASAATWAQRDVARRTTRKDEHCSQDRHPSSEKMALPRPALLRPALPRPALLRPALLRPNAHWLSAIPPGTAFHLARPIQRDPRNPLSTRPTVRIESPL